MTPDPCAAYLECRYDRVQALRTITRRITHQLYERPASPTERRRLTIRLARAHRYIIALTGD